MAATCRLSMRAMLRLILVVLVLAAGTLAPALAVSADTASWRGEYYNNTSLSGWPALVRDDASINFDWGTGGPGSGVNADNFSVNWTSFQSFSEGSYNFHLTSDDGVRLWVDDQLLIDQWNDHAATTYHATKYLGGGYHSMRVAYYEKGDKAVAHLWWDTGSAPAGNWRGEYYNNNWLGGTPLVRTDTAISFDWGVGSPAGGINADYFSVRWTWDAYFGLSTNYTFYATVDDGVRVWVDGALIIDKWYPQSRTTHAAAIWLNAGTHNVRVEYFEQTGDALCIISWAVGSGGGGGEIVVDDRDAGFVWGGPTSSFYSRATGYRGHLYWTWNASSTIRNWAKWFPNVSQPGNYNVYVYVASRYFGSKSARYVVSLNGAQHARTVNQNNYYNQWVGLGTYYFGGGSGEYVFLGDATGERYGTRYVGFDAVKFVKTDGGGVPPPPPPPPPSGCAINPVLGFGAIWNSDAGVRARLGCATEAEKSIWAGEQSFVWGYMFWRQDQTYIYVLYNNGTWQGFSDTWTTAEPEWDPTIVPPGGYYQPKRGFGKVWRNNANVRNGLSWATTEEHGFQGAAQAFTGGTMLWSNTRGVYVLYSDGTWVKR